MAGITDSLSRFDVRRVVESLVMPEESPEPQGFDHTSSRAIQVDYDVDRPDKSTEEYYRLYRTNPILTHSINNTATEVIEPGWYIDAESEETIDELTEFMENVAIVDDEVRQNFSKLVYKAVIQYLVRGVFMTEKVDKDGRPNALNPLQAETFEIYTKPGTNILLSPDDLDYEGSKRTQAGEAAAYVQFDNSDSRWSTRREKRFSRDQIIKWARNADIGEPFGNSIIEPVFERALALESKLRDNDDAIAMKAWPGVLFQMGSEENPWSRTEMDDFMEDFEADNFGPGLMKAVAGDVSIEEFAGETADIGDAVGTDVDFIVTGMPGPKYALGGFNDDVGTSVASAQERQFRKTVRQIRREVEDKFTPYLVEVAEAFDLDTEGIELNLGRPQGDINPEDVSGSIIRYTSDVSGDGAQPTDEDGNPIQTIDKDDPRHRNTNDQPAVPDMTDLRAEPAALYRDHPGSDKLSSGFGEVNHHDQEAEELADPRLVSTTEEASEIQSLIESVLYETRDRSIENLRAQASDATPSATMLEGAVADATSIALSEQNAMQAVEDHLESVVRRSVDTMSQQNHAPVLRVEYGMRHNALVEQIRDGLIRDVRSVVDDLERTMRQQLEQSQSANETLDLWADRVTTKQSDDTIEHRARIITRMRTQQAINRTKLNEYERSEKVVGVRVINRCTDSTTRLCRNLAGCGAREPATARFDDDRSIGEQFSEHIDDDLLYAGFTPLPSLPPFHWGCNSEIVPVEADE